MPTATKKFTKAELAAIYDEARAAGLAAGEGDKPPAMVVAQHLSPLDDGSPVIKSWLVPDGPCGFAWVNVPGNSPFGRFLKAEKGCHAGYPKGVNYWVGDHRQSLSRKEAHARAFAEVLRKHGIERVYADSRMD